MVVTTHNTWVGFVATVGGMLNGAGLESMLGVVARADFAAHCDVNSTSVRVGLGLGGSGGTAVLVALNRPNIDYFQNAGRQDGWGMALALPSGGLAITEAGRDAPQSLSGVLPAVTRASQATMQARLTPDNVGDLFNFVQALVSAGQVSTAAVARTPPASTSSAFPSRVRPPRAGLVARAAVLMRRLTDIEGIRQGILRSRQSGRSLRGNRTAERKSAGGLNLESTAPCAAPPRTAAIGFVTRGGAAS